MLKFLFDLGRDRNKPLRLFADLGLVGGCVVVAGSFEYWSLDEEDDEDEENLADNVARFVLEGDRGAVVFSWKVLVGEGGWPAFPIWEACTGGWASSEILGNVIVTGRLFFGEPSSCGAWPVFA